MKRIPLCAIALTTCAMLLSALTLTSIQVSATPGPLLPDGTPLFLPGVSMAPPALTAISTPVPTTAPTITPTTTPGIDTAAEVLIPAGTFKMGCDDENALESCYRNEVPLHTVNLDAYYIDKYEVTNARYKACLDSGGCTPLSDVNTAHRKPYFGNETYDDYPVIYVDWMQANTFCHWAGGRLPTEAEWEKAARGSDMRKYPWGDSSPNCSMLNFAIPVFPSRCCVGDTTRVGSYPIDASPFGVMDVGGNVSEWVNDWYSEAYYRVSPTDNPQGPATGTDHIARGGQWADYAVKARTASRLEHNLSDDVAGNWIGFRCARSQ